MTQELTCTCGKVCSVCGRPSRDLQAAQSWFRPIFSWIFTISFVVLVAVIIYLLVLGVAAFAEVSGVLMTMLGSGGAISGLYAHGRTKEKLAQRESEMYQAPTELGEGEY